MQRLFDEVNHHLALGVSSHPRFCLLFSIILSALFSASLFNCTVEKDIRKSFSPPKSRSSREERIHTEFFNLTASPERAFVLFYAKDGGTMLRREQMEEMYGIDKIIMQQINSTDGDVERMCNPLCNLNKPIKLFWNELISQDNESLLNESASSTIFDFPTSNINGYEIFIGMNMFGVFKSEHVFANRSKITHVKSIVLWYFWQTNNAEKKALLAETTTQIFEMSKARNYTKLINFDVFGDAIANAEMMRGAFEATKLMVLGFFLLLGFVFAVVWSKVDMKTLPRVVLAAVLSPFLAAAVAFGILSWLGFPIYSIMCVTPFLILGIGVDDAFIMLESWNHFRGIKSKKERLSRVFVEIGPSISITSFTNTVAFGIGYLTPTPQMSMFCLCTSVACLIDYILTFSLFAPILYMSEGDDEEYVMSEKMSRLELRRNELIAKYSDFLCSWKGKAVAALILTVLYALCTVGVLSMKSTFEPSKAFPSDSPLSHSLDGIKAVFNEFFPLQIVVSNPPNISDPIEYATFYEMVSALESVPLNYGRNRTLLFLKAYEEFDRKFYEFFHSFGLSGAGNYTPSYDNLAFFVKQIGGTPAIRLEPDKSGVLKLKAFQFTIVARNMSEWSNRAIYVERCRSVVAMYPQLNASVYDGDSAVLELILTVKTDLVGSIAVTVICMAIVCLFFITSRAGLLIITFTISSICFTLVGALSWWGADMDPVTMVDVLIATGFSVDYTAHIAYKFYRGVGNKRELIEQSLREMSAPMMQAGTSTVLCMLPLIHVPTYAILAFAKTVFLVVGLGLLHGLLILPVLLTTFSSDPAESRLFEKGIQDDSSKRKQPLLT